MISFPPEIYQPQSSEDFNPAIRLFGRRFSDDQQTMDMLAEFLLVFNCVSFLVYLQSGCHALRACARRTDGGVLNTPQCTPQWLP